MVETITLTGISGYGYHGVLDTERNIGQEFVVDVEYALSMLAAARSDELVDTLSYAEVAESVRSLIVGPPFKLIETLAHAIADSVIIAGPVESVTVSVHKPSAPIAVRFTDVVLRVTRSAADQLRKPHRATIALGANLGDTAQTIQAAIAELAAADAVTVVAQSETITSTALTTTGLDNSKPKYANAVVNVDTLLSPLALLDLCQSIENAHGRVRAEKWGDRTLDLDIIDYSGQRWHTDRLKLPHPEAHKRSFVIAPWLQIEPDAYLPGIGQVSQIKLPEDAS